ncbi:MAG: transcriptional repressor [Bdellovibrionales bacterium]|nr:transcriptional repressor [Bdellovibrionales bacterium]
MSKTLPCGRKRAVSQSKTDRSGDLWRPRLNEFLKKKGLRATRPRDLVAGIALSKKSHFDIQTLVKDVSFRYPEISPATVYRTVGTLCEADLLTETMQSKGGVSLYEPSLEDEHHDHVVCIDCNEIIEFHDSNLERAQNRAVESMEFKPVRHRHVIYARCLKLGKVED